MITFNLLGPLEIHVDHRVVEAGEPRRRAILASLLIDADRVVSSATMIGRVWGEQAPAQASKVLASHVSKIRRVLRQAAEDDGGSVRIVNMYGGYRLTVDPENIDLHRARRLAYEARDEGLDVEQRVALLREAFALWRGETFAGIGGDWADRTRDRLTIEHLETVVAWADAELQVDNPAVVLSPLTELADEYPLMEDLTVMMVRALVAMGRPSEALDRCLVHRQRLADKQGTDQCARLRALYEEVLHGQHRAA
jgi:DNA-binding SARP family transcriptional activator